MKTKATRRATQTSSFTLPADGHLSADDATPIYPGYERITLLVDFAGRKAGQWIDVLPRRREVMVASGQATYKTEEGKQDA